MLQEATIVPETVMLVSAVPARAEWATSKPNTNTLILLSCLILLVFIKTPMVGKFILKR
jgi:hypothetical protein